MSRRSRSRRARSAGGGNGSRLVFQLLLGAVLAVTLGVLLGRAYYAWMFEADQTPNQDAVEQEELEEDFDGEFSFEDEELGEEPPSLPEEEGGDEEEEPARTFSLNLPSLRLYRVQVAAFSQAENAEGLLEELEKQGFKGYITSGDDFYRVNSSFFLNRNLAIEFASNLEGEEEILQEAPLVLAQDLPAQTLSGAAGEEEYFRGFVAVVSDTVALTEKLENLWLDYKTGVKDKSQVLSELEGLNRDISQVVNRAGNLAPPPKFPGT